MLGSFFLLLLKSSPLDFYRFYQEPPGICETFLHWHPFKSTSFSYILSYTPEISTTFSFGISISSIGLWGFSLKRRIRLQNRKISYTSCIRGVTWNKSFFFSIWFSSSSSRSNQRITEATFQIWLHKQRFGTF